MSAVPLLHNMSVRPTTTVTWECHALGPTLVGFSIDACAAARECGDAEAEAAWERYGLTGAVLLYHVPSQENRCATPQVWVSDPALVLNVLGRTRGTLLLPGFPLDRDDERLGRRLSTDDPRIVALAKEANR